MARVTRKQAYDIVDSERAYQEMRVERDHGNRSRTPEEFIVYMEHYLFLARQAAATTWGPGSGVKVMDAIRKVTALGVAAIETNGCPRREGF